MVCRNNERAQKAKAEILQSHQKNGLEISADNLRQFLVVLLKRALFVVTKTCSTYRDFFTCCISAIGLYKKILNLHFYMTEPLIYDCSLIAHMRRLGKDLDTR